MVTQVMPEGTIAWVTGTAGTCVSIFKPVFVDVEWSGLPVPPTEQYNPRSLWWKHEIMHRRAMADFESVVPEIRQEFDVLEREFIANASAVLAGEPKEKRLFMEHCFHQAQRATEQWVRRLSGRGDLAFVDPAHHSIWHKYNRQAGIPEPMPPLA